MAKIYNYDVMFDDTSIDVSKEVALVWSIANSLRGAYTSDKYKDVIIPRMDKIRDSADKIEVMTDRNYWPYPSYADLLFGVR